MKKIVRNSQGPRMPIDKILVPVDFSACSDAALAYALSMADECGAQVEVLHVWSPRDREGRASTIFADTPEGIAMERALSAAESDHAARICGRLEFGEEPSSVILDILERERFDLVVVGRGGRSKDQGGHVSAHLEREAPCKVVALPIVKADPNRSFVDTFIAKRTAGGFDAG
ncbi:hypothetical protein AKJ09_03615 [Labilithrix luteola]|uniref:UspA domain-containing protein n=1 Tax=Labilithrix luteola TaxID=1391654 RepID=A0A0K1PUA6_9BACT|nr:universal stress protein [Labilithrix luteola]AKU96951.1 hypothetical protein AKJ09_03615 [Labilithrix luteola]